MDTKGLYKISYGVYAVTSGKIKCNGQIANTVVQVSSQPPTIAVAINKQNFTHEIINQSKILAVSILSQDTSMQFIGDFGFRSGRDCDKFAGYNYIIGVTGTRVVTDYTVAYIEAKITKQIDVSTHTLFIGEVVDTKVLNDKPPMTYDYYHQIKKGTTPKTAPTFTAVEEKSENQVEAKYVCKVCGYTYDPARGDPEHGIAPGTPFEKLPDNWVCPICKAKKEMFEKKK